MNKQIRTGVRLACGILDLNFDNSDIWFIDKLELEEQFAYNWKRLAASIICNGRKMEVLTLCHGKYIVQLIHVYVRP